MPSVIVDFNNLAIRCFFTKEVEGNTENPQYSLWKYLITENVYNFMNNFNANEVILAVDDKDSWRKAAFSRYKEDRKTKRDKSDVDWTRLFEEFEEIQQHIKQYLPFKVIKSSRAEADDIIAVLSKYTTKNTTIISNDSDYLQLCDNKKVKVFNPTKEAYMQLKEDKETFISKMCLAGQAKDNIFNVLTPSDYPAELRKPGLGEKTANKIMNEGLEQYLNKTHKLKKEGYEKEFSIRKNFDRNRRLIDFDLIPNVIDNSIKKCYDEYKLPDPAHMYSFFKQREWVGFTDDWNKTENTLMKLY